jgi:hypothetical protein
VNTFFGARARERSVCAPLPRRRRALSLSRRAAAPLRAPRRHAAPRARRVGERAARRRAAARAAAVRRGARAPRRTAHARTRTALTHARTRCRRRRLPPSTRCRPHLLSACFFALGFGTLLPWSTCVVTLPWLAAASRRAPAPPPLLADSLLGALTLTFSLSNALCVALIARLDLARTLPPAWQVPRPLVACALLQAGAACAAARDARGDPLGGALLVAIALPLALAQGVLTAFINCGAAAQAGPRPARVMRAYTSGQALAGARHLIRASA